MLVLGGQCELRHVAQEVGGVHGLEDLLVRGAAALEARRGTPDAIAEVRHVDRVGVARVQRRVQHAALEVVSPLGRVARTRRVGVGEGEVAAAVLGLVEADLRCVGRREATAVDGAGAVPGHRRADEVMLGVGGVEHHGRDGAVPRHGHGPGDGVEAGAPVGGHEQALSGLGVTGAVGLARADVQRRRVAGVDDQRADGVGGQPGVQRNPLRGGGQRVVRTPYAAAGGPEVDGAVLRGAAGPYGERRGAAGVGGWRARVGDLPGHGARRRADRQPRLQALAGSDGGVGVARIGGLGRIDGRAGVGLVGVALGGRPVDGLATVGRLLLDVGQRQPGGAPATRGQVVVHGQRQLPAACRGGGRAGVGSDDRRCAEHCGGDGGDADGCDGSPTAAAVGSHTTSWWDGLVHGPDGPRRPVWADSITPGLNAPGGARFRHASPGSAGRRFTRME